MGALEWNGDRLKLELTKAINQSLNLTGIAAARLVRKDLNQTIGPSAPGNPPGVRSGSLRNSITSSKARDFRVKIGTNIKYAAIHEFGGTIKPRKGPYLVIPVGGTRRKPESFRRVRSVKMPPRPFIAPAVKKHGPELDKYFRRQLKSGLKDWIGRTS